MGMEFKFGRMVPNTKVTGDSTKLAVMESSGTSTEMFSKANGLTIKPMVGVFMFTRMVLDMKVSGKMIFSTAKVKKSGPTTQSTKAAIMKVRSMEEVSTFGKTVQVMMATGMKTESKVKEFTNGRTEEPIPDNGKIIICTATESTLGQMVADMKVNTKWIKSMAMVSTVGPTEEFMKVIGSMESSMAKASTSSLMVLLRLVSGSTAREPTG